MLCGNLLRIFFYTECKKNETVPIPLPQGIYNAKGKVSLFRCGGEERRQALSGAGWGRRRVWWRSLTGAPSGGPYH